MIGLDPDVLLMVRSNRVDLFFFFFFFFFAWIFSCTVEYLSLYIFFLRLDFYVLGDDLSCEPSIYVSYSTSEFRVSWYR